MTIFRVILFLILILTCTVLNSQEFIPARILQRLEPALPDSVDVATLAASGRYKVEILPDSTVGNIRIERSAGWLDSLAMNSIREWSFAPVFLEGIAQTAELNVTIEFGKQKTESDEEASERLSAEADSLKIWRLELKKNATEYIKAEKERWLAEKPETGIQKENNHLFGINSIPETVIRSGFYERASYITDFHYRQNWRIFYNIEDDSGYLRFKREVYSLPVAYSRTFLGTGDRNMNYAILSLRKGYLLNVKGWSGRFDYAGYEGNWLGVNEKVGDFLFESLYESNIGNFRYHSSLLRHEIPARALSLLYRPATSFGAIDEEIKEHQFSWSGREFEVSYRLRQDKYSSGFQSISTIEQTHHALFLRKQHNIGIFSFNGGIQTDVSIDANPCYNLYAEAGVQPGKLQLQMSYLGGVKNTPYLATYIGWKLTENLKLRADARHRYKHEKYKKQSLREVHQEATGGLELQFSWLELTLNVGQRKTEQDFELSEGATLSASVKETYWISGLAGTTVYSIGRIRMKLTGESNFISTGVLFNLPRLQHVVAPEINYMLEHNNMLKCGAEFHYCGVYHAPELLSVPETKYLNAWFAIQITEHFQIRLDAHNLTNEVNLYDVIPAAMHLNTGIRWIFIN
ncbi:MAG: energy transducer TonB [Candidatus Cloacimonetes bacterium]|nr:energy transducer TonB [Candidatus Cloacimonadota bacterium]